MFRPRRAFHALPFSLALSLVCVLAATGCSALYYKTMEKFGVEKRDILVKRVAQARDSQQEAKEQFASALDKFRSVVNFNGGDLEAKYNELKDELDAAEARAKDVHNRIASVQEVSDDLFAEWEKELDQYHDASLRRKSADELRQTRQRCEQLLSAMHRAEDRIQPVLNPLEDKVLFLKHQLNAQAVAGLQGELTQVQDNVDSLIRDLNRSIDEANSFIDSMNTKP